MTQQENSTGPDTRGQLEVLELVQVQITQKELLQVNTILSLVFYIFIVSFYSL